MIFLAWLSSVVVVVLAGVAAAATRMPTLAGQVRSAVAPVVVLLAVVVVADLASVLSGPEAERPDSMLTHVGYAVATIGLLPLLVWRRPPEGGSEGATAEAEPEPVSLWVVVVAALATAVCVIRLVQTQ